MIPFSVILNIFLNVIIPFGNKEPIIIDNADTPLLSQVFIDSQLYQEYSYSGANLISEEKRNYQYIKHNYNAKNQLISSDYYVDFSSLSSNSTIVKKRKEWISPDNSEKSYSITFEYNENGQLIKSIDRSVYSLFKYDNKNRISRQTYYDANGSTRYIDYDYDKKGNLIKMSQFEIMKSGNPQLITTYEYEFDNKFNPYSAFKSLMMPGRNTNVNNITKEIYTLHFMEHEVNDKRIDEYIYEYNDEGYPKSINKSFEYFYK